MYFWVGQFFRAKEILLPKELIGSQLSSAGEIFTMDVTGRERSARGQIYSKRRFFSFLHSDLSYLKMNSTGGQARVVGANVG